MAPPPAAGFEQLREADLDDEEFDEDDLDFSDLREKYEVALDQGYDHFVVVDGLPTVTEEQKPKLVKFLLKKLNTVGKTREDQIYMPMGDDGKSLKYVNQPIICLVASIIISQSSAIALPSSSSHRPPRPALLFASWTWFPSTRSTHCALTS